MTALALFVVLVAVVFVAAEIDRKRCATIADLREELAVVKRDRTVWARRATQREARRAEWEADRDRLYDATIRLRRLRPILAEARRWKRIAIAYGWHRGDKAAPGVLCACDEWHAGKHLDGCPFGHREKESE